MSAYEQGEGTLEELAERFIVSLAYGKKLRGQLQRQMKSVEQRRGTPRKPLDPPRKQLRDALLEDMSRNDVGLQPHREIWKHRTKNGAFIEVETVCNHLDFHGTNSALVTAVDGTGRNRAQEMLQDSQKKYRVLFEDSGDATLLLDENGMLIAIRRR